jgi:hypothetical protein
MLEFRRTFAEKIESVAMEVDHSVITPHGTRDGIEQCGFARSVGAYQTYDLSFTYLKVLAAKGCHSAKRFCYLTYFEE